MKKAYKLLFKKSWWLRQKYHWHFIASNGKELCRSSENYYNLDDCENSWYETIEHGKDAIIVYNFSPKPDKII